MTLAERIVRACRSWAPAYLRHWTDGMAREAAEIDRPVPALAFALGCAAWAARAGLADALRRSLSPSGNEMNGEIGMMGNDLWRGRGLALTCAVAATLLGLVYLRQAGAPMQLMTMNLAALVAGLVLTLPLLGRDPIQRPLGGVLAVAIGAALLLTAALGQEASGVRRWMSLGGIVLQPSLILVPLLIVIVARSRDALTAVGTLLAAGALALQPDRAMAGAMVAGLAMVVGLSRDRLGIVCLGAAIAGFAVTWMRPDVVPPTLFVDRVFRTAFSTGIVSGAAVWGGALLLIVPPALGMIRDKGHRAIHAGFGTTWLAIIVAAIAGDYPTPVVAYGGSAIVGYILAVIGLPLGSQRSTRQSEGVAATEGSGEADARLAVAS